MKGAKKALSLLLVTALLTPVICSCSENGTNNSDIPKNESESLTDASGSGDTGQTDTEDENAFLYEDLPSGYYDERTFSILTPAHSESDFIGDIEGDIISEAIYKRNIATEENLSIKINLISEPGLWDQRDSYMNKIKNSVIADDDSFQLISGYAAYITSLAMEGVLANWNDIGALNFTKPWWNRDIVNELNINGKLYYITGDLSMTYLDYLFSIFFNKDILNDNQLESPYELVREGSWTLEKLKTLASAVEMDVDGNGRMNDKDLYGYSSDCTNFVTAYQCAFGANITTKDENGIPRLSIENEDFINKFLDLYSFLCESSYVFISNVEGSYTDDLNREATKIFIDSRALFEPNLLGNAASMRGVDVNFGIIPYPKYDESQEEYRTTSWDGYNLFLVPTTADLGFTGVVTEYMAAQSYKLVLPAFYEKALLTKYARDNDSADMIELIRDSASYNFGEVNSVHCGNIGHVYRELVSARDSNISSKIKSKSKIFQKSLEKFLQSSYEVEK